MKKKLNLIPNPKARRGRKRGIALITVLLVLSLMVILVLAILSTSLNATSSASRGANSIRVKDLANTVTSLAISQIRAATTAAPDAQSGEIPPFTWISQPGMIRTFDQDGFLAAYPLYSSSTGDITTKESILQEASKIASWNNSPERFVDLNQPSITYDSSGSESGRIFPILDPRASTIDLVEGFTINTANAPGAGLGGQVSAGNLLPMPVEWLYMLKDGTLGALSSTGAFSGSSQASKSNPIIARVAYWVDDDSTKININTASEGVFWDVPRATTVSGQLLGNRQPAGSEASRFPGHPATTCLSSVFFPNHYPDYNSALQEKELTKEHLEKLYELAPKINWGGTQGGTITSDNNTILEFDQDRLYASIDEMVFRMASNSGTRMRNSVFEGEDPVDVERIERARGLFTAHSRAPELNIFGRPRMATWPLHENDRGRSNEYRSAFDNAIAFAATLGSRDGRNPRGTTKFFLQRRDSQSRTWEFYRNGEGNNKRLYQYVMDQTHQPLPGYGKSLAQKYGASSDTYFDYSRAASESERELERFDSTRDHAKIGAMIFDYLRGTNLYDANVTDPYADIDGTGGGFRPFGQSTCFILHDTNLQSGDGGNDSTEWHKFMPKPKGMGRLYTISEVAMVIFCSADGTLTSAGKPNMASEFPYRNVRTADRPRFSGLRGNGADRDRLQEHPLAFNSSMERKNLRYLQVGMVFELFCPMQGFHMIHPLTTLQMITGGKGYKGAFGAFDGSDALASKDFVRDTSVGYRDFTGYKIRSASGFDNPITYWGAQPNGPSADNRATGPVLQTIPIGETDIRVIKQELPESWYGWGGYGGYRILRFADISISPGTRTLHADALPEMTNVSRDNGGRLGGVYAQKPIVVDAPRSTNRGTEPKMQLIAPRDEQDGNYIPMQFLIYDALSDDLSNGQVLQTIEVAFPTGTLPVPELAHSNQWEGWGRRYGRAGRDESADGRVDVITRNDVVRSMIPTHGDYRHIAAKRFVPQTLWREHPYYEDEARLKAHSLSWSNPSGAEEVRSGQFRSQLGALGATFLDDINADHPANTTDSMDTAYRFTDTRTYINDPKSNAKFKDKSNRARRYRPDFTFDPEDKEGFAPGINHQQCKIAFDPGVTRDFDNGVGSARDGSYTNKADDGADVSRGISNPYFEVPVATRFDYRDATSVDNTYSPNQAIPSPVVFGSLPSLVDANIPWNTLLFRPNMLPLDGKHPQSGEEIIRFGARGVGVEIDYDIQTSTPNRLAGGRRPGGSVTHQGVVYTRTKSVEDPQLPPEHLWLDLFWMPTVQPYPLSEPFSTAGKINLNYQMVPFSYIDRATALHALFKAERMLAIPTDAVDTYKDGADDENRRVDFVTDVDDENRGDSWYKKIDAENTLLQFKEKFEDGDVFMTESEICEMFLYPKTSNNVEYDEQGKNIRDFWDEHKLTGDNTLERPYANLYPRLTTKSNVFTVHMTVQVLQKARSTDPRKWEDADRVVAEYRGASTIERYIDPNRSLGTGDGQMPVYISDRNRRGSASNQEGLEKFYEYRVVNQRQFAH